MSAIKLTPSMMGADVNKSFPNAPKPTTLKMPPITGPLNSPPSIKINTVEKIPNHPIFIMVAPIPPISM